MRKTSTLFAKRIVKKKKNPSHWSYKYIYVFDCDICWWIHSENIWFDCHYTSKKIYFIDIFSCRRVLFMLIPHVFQTPNFSSVSIYRLHNKPLPFCPETHRIMCPSGFHPLQTLCFHRIWTKNFVFRLKQPWHLKVWRFSCALYTRHRGNTAGMRSSYHNMTAVFFFVCLFLMEMSIIGPYSLI